MGRPAALSLSHSKKAVRFPSVATRARLARELSAQTARWGGVWRADQGVLGLRLWSRYLSKSFLFSLSGHGRGLSGGVGTRGRGGEQA
jgi:hypothetical protein